MLSKKEDQYLVQQVREKERKRKSLVLICCIIHCCGALQVLQFNPHFSANSSIIPCFPPFTPFISQASRVLSSMVMAGDKLGGNLKKYFQWLRSMVSKGVSWAVLLQSLSFVVVEKNYVQYAFASKS
jgi:hypothetical protein